MQNGNRPDESTSNHPTTCLRVARVDLQSATHADRDDGINLLQIRIIALQPKRLRQQQLWPVRGSRASDRCIVYRAKCEDNGLLDVVRIVPRGGMKTTSVKEQYIAGHQFNGLSSPEQRLIFFQIRSQKQSIVKNFFWSGAVMCLWEDLETAVLRILRAQRNPDVDQIPSRE